MELGKIVKELRSYPGLLRKKFAGKFYDLVANFFGEDAGFFDLCDYSVVFTTDGIWHKVLEKDLYWGGFVSILVNVHDVYAMGAKPKYAVNVVSAKDEKALEEIKRGLAEAAEKYGVEILKGHVHPDSPQNSIDVAMIGFAKKGCLIRSNSAKVGDSIIIAVDTKGKPRKNLPYNFDSTDKDSKILLHQLDSMILLAEKKLVNAGKDLSNAGIVGTVAMMLEVSEKGALIDLERIPKPENVELVQWLKSYPACGFCVTTDYAEEVIKIFRKHGLEADVVGKIDSSRVLKIKLNNEEEIFMDFSRESVFGR